MCSTVPSPSTSGPVLGRVGPSPYPPRCKPAASIAGVGSRLSRAKPTSQSSLGCLFLATAVADTVKLSVPPPVLRAGVGGIALYRAAAVASATGDPGPFDEVATNVAGGGGPALGGGGGGAAGGTGVGGRPDHGCGGDVSRQGHGHHRPSHVVLHPTPLLLPRVGRRRTSTCGHA